jgi:hypothetical protein
LKVKKVVGVETEWVEPPTISGIVVLLSVITSVKVTDFKSGIQNKII